MGTEQRFWIGRERNMGRLECTEMLSWNEYQFLIRQLRIFRFGENKTNGN